MQVTKGGWVGQTFALAKLNDSSGGKKSKKRSKEERKGMVETFIKRYQASNNGSFPSLNLTHKEVGGSYYTVREIFREVIQENRVLAPPKLPPGEQNMENLDSFLEHYPLGSISVDPNIHVVPPKDFQTLLNEYEFRSEKVLNSRRITKLRRGSLDNDNIINGSTHTTVENEEFEDPRYRELLVKRVEEGPKGEGEIIDAETSQISGSDVVETTHAAVTNKISEEQMRTESPMKRDNKGQRNEGLELEPKASQIPEAIVVETAHAMSSEEFEELKHTELLMERDMEGQKEQVKELEAYQAQIHPLSEDVMVETFPLRPVSSTVYNVDEKTSEKEVLDGDLELATGNDESSVHNEVHLVDNSTEVVDTKLEEELASPLPKFKPIATLETQDLLCTDENIVLDVNNITDNKFDDASPAEDKASSSPNGLGSQNLDGNNSIISLQQSTFEGTTANMNKSNRVLSGTAEKQTVGAMLKRINPESWEAAASKKSGSQETNPIMSFIKSFVAAFVKFWSE